MLCQKNRKGERKLRVMEMNKRDTLSIAPYYGGKGRMAHFIADRLNYDDSDIFVTPFGGMCRVLLNKPRHKIECYNDYSDGLTALMRILSDPVRSVEFIHRLEDETTYSEEEFNKQKVIFDYAEKDLEEQTKMRLRQLLIDKGIVDSHVANSLLDEIMWQAYEMAEKAVNPKRKTPPHKITPAVQDSLTRLQEVLRDDEKQAHEKPKGERRKFQLELRNCLADWIEAYQVKKNAGFLERSSDLGLYVSDMDLAIATYVVFQQSRDGMGKVWSAEKFKTNDQYKKQIVRLFDCAERLEGVEVFQIDAVDFFREFKFIDVNLPDEEIDPGFLMLNEWISNPRVMMYCDPSYISVESEKKLLEGIDVDSTPCLSDAIKKKYGDKMPANLGKVYAMSFNYDDQEKFLRCIQKAKCRILVSNYDLQLYNKYLNEDTGWQREEFHTTTGVGGKKDNKRVEVIWYNY